MVLSLENVITGSRWEKKETLADAKNLWLVVDAFSRWIDWMNNAELG